MASVLDLKRRIRSVKNTRQITKAMKMVSAARLRRAQERALNSRPYAQMLISMLQSLKRRIELVDPTTGEIRSPLLVTREQKTVLLVVVAGDKGFAGAFNANIFKAANQFIAFEGDRQIDIEPVGRKARDHFRKKYPAAIIEEHVPTEQRGRDSFGERDGGRGVAGEEEEQASRPVERAGQIQVTGDHPGILEKLEFKRIDEISRDIVRRYAREEIDGVYVVYNEFKSVISQRLVVERILPILEIGRQDIAQAQELSKEERERAAEAAASAGITITGLAEESEADAEQAEEEAKKFGTSEVDYIYEQPPAELFASLLPRYVTIQLYHAMLESVAAEHAARMTAMDSASNNASDMIDSYTLAMNRARQAAITKEIIEIVSGAAALS
ncbi:ATP synthase gamma chain [Acidisarcina polymorpha]|uniref:ATP synthase gamma chain n=1 Tax=Acidisarcina polymorpha TaxID=2211140 RepID=A0A2Z5FY21_9BACT|nr:FoF1 ATP synthase subunit gamma [Acidisarcina polymorpha]AXC11367.1 ATP synthase gamma chain [Acidisarcina polymorpha]